MDREEEESEGGRCDLPVYPCPSFSSYSASGLADVAGRVCRENEEEEEFESKPELASADFSDIGGNCDVDDDDDGDFEFVSLVKNSDQVLIGGGYVGPVFPVFNRDLLSVGEGGEAVGAEEEEDERERSIMIPLKELFLEDRDPASCSSSEVDELEAVPEGTYCVWTPRFPAVEPSPARCKKSNSTGSCSKRWRFRDLLRRSNSDGKDSFVFLTPHSGSSPTAKGSDSKEKRSSTSEVKAAAGTAAGKEKGTASAHEAFYVRNRAMKEGDRRKSYLPYRKDLVGFFANVNGLGRHGRSFPPF